MVTRIEEHLQAGEMVYSGILHPDVLELDLRYQRPANEMRVRRIAANYDPLMRLPLVVSLRQDGRYFVVDGQHRLLAERRLQMRQPIPCTIIKHLSYDREAGLFARLNSNRNRLATSRAQQYKARLEEGHPPTWAIEDVLTALQLAVDYTTTSKVWNKIGAVVALEDIANVAGIDLLRRVLLIARDAWSGDRMAFKSDLLLGLAALLRRATPHGLDDATLIDKLRVTSPAHLLGRAAAARGIVDVRGGAGVGRALLEYYNSGKRTRRLPSWEEMVLPRQENRSRSGSQPQRLSPAAPDEQETA